MFLSCQGRRGHQTACQQHSGEIFSERKKHEVCGGKVTLLKPVDAALLASLEYEPSETCFKGLQA